MARRSRLRQRQKEDEARKVDEIEGLGWALLVDARGLDEEFTACLVLLIARDRRRALNRSRRYGPRGNYDMKRPLEFFEHILYHAEERYFRGWLRYSPLSQCDGVEFRVSPVHQNGSRSLLGVERLDQD